MAQQGAVPPLVKAKLLPPRLSDACLRPSTLASLEESFRRRLTLVCAPAGYGKTTVTLEAVRRLGLRSVWYKLDVLDQDPIALIASLVEALSALHEGFGQTIRDRLANAHDVPYPIEQMAAEFVAEATETIVDDVHLLLDDYHEAADSRSLNVTLDYLVANLPPTMRFVVLSRYEPAFEVGKLKLDGQFGIVGIEELRFGPDEVLEVVSRRTGTSLSPERAAALADLTEGWPASVVLAALTARWVGVEALESALSDPRLKQDVFSYLAEQVYSRESEEVRTFLRRTCCLDHVSSDLARRVGAPRKAHRILAHLLANGAFTFATAELDTFRYHSLFQEFLRQKSVQEDGPESFHRLQLTTADALEAHGDTARAVDLCLAANEPRLGLAVIARAGALDLDAFRSDTLEGWIARWPDEIRRREPWARLVAAEVDMRAGRFDDAVHQVDCAIESIGAQGSRRDLYRALSTKERTLFWKGDTTEAANACRRALEAVETTEQRVHTLISLGAALNAECRWAEATEALDAARDLADGSLPTEQARLAAQRVYAAGNAGSYTTAIKAADDARETWANHGSPSLFAASLTLSSATRLFTADWTGARKDIDDARQLGARYGFVYIQALVDDVDGQILSSIGERERAVLARERAVSAPSIVDDPYCLSMAVCHAGTAARRDGDRDEAIREYTRAAEIARGTAARHAYLNAVANLAFTHGTPHGATRTELVAIAQEARSNGLLFIALKAEFFAATLLYRGGDRRSALDRLATCVPRQLELGHLNFLAQELVLEPEMTADLLHRAAAPETVELLLDLIARHWNGMPLIISAISLDPVASLAATRAAAAHLSGPELSSVLTKAGRCPFPEVRKAVAGLRRERRGRSGGAPGEPLDLTPREMQIMHLIAEGMTNDDVACRLVISPATVKTHVNHIFTKLGARDRVRAVLIFREALMGRSE